MKKILLTIIAIFCCLAGFASSFDGKVKINIILKTQSDATELRMTADALSTKTERRDFVVNALKNQAKDSQSDLLDYLNILEINNIVEDIRPLWIVNSVSCYAEESLIDEISLRDDVLAVYRVEEFSLPEEENFSIPEDAELSPEAENLILRMGNRFVRAFSHEF